MYRLLRKLAALDAGSLADLLLAQVFLLRAGWRKRTHPIGSLTAHGAMKAVAPAPVGGDPVRARAIALAVLRAAEHGLFRPFCLVRAIALRDLLERERITGSEIRVGVRQRRGKFEAHAWVRWNDEVLGDVASHIATFTEVDDMRVLGNG